LQVQTSVSTVEVLLLHLEPMVWGAVWEKIILDALNTEKLLNQTDLAKSEHV